MALALVLPLDSASKHPPFVRSSFIAALMERGSRYLKNGLALNLMGSSGVGKTTLAITMARDIGNPVMFVQGHRDMSISDLVGGYQGYRYHKVIDNFIRDVVKIDQQVNSFWTEGWLAQAIKNGYTVVFDEFNRVQSEVQAILLAVLQEQVLPVSHIGHHQVIPVHPDFRLIMTSGMPDQVGSYPVLEGLWDRVITMSLDALDEESEVMIVQAHAQLPIQESQQIIRLLRHIRNQSSRQRKAPRSGMSPSIRTGIAIALLLKSEGWSLLDQQLPPDFSKIIQDLCGPMSAANLKDIEHFLSAENA